MVIVGPCQLKYSILFLFVAEINQVGFLLPKAQPVALLVSPSRPVPPGAPSCPSAFSCGMEVESRGAVAVEYRGVQGRIICLPNLRCNIFAKLLSGIGLSIYSVGPLLNMYLNVYPVLYFSSLGVCLFF